MYGDESFLRIPITIKIFDQTINQGDLIPLVRHNSASAVSPYAPLVHRAQDGPLSRGLLLGAVDEHRLRLRKVRIMRVKTLFQATLTLAACLSLLSVAMPSHAQRTVTGNDAGYYPWETGLFHGSYVSTGSTGSKPIMTLTRTGTYNAKWGTKIPGGTPYSGNFTLGRGWSDWSYGNPAGAKLPQQITNVGYNCYTFEHNKGGGLSLYGWRLNPSGSDYGSSTTAPKVVEWYVKELEGAIKDGGTPVGATYTSNGASYKAYRFQIPASPTRPTPLGTGQAFVQYISIRVNPYVPGPVSAGGTGNATITAGNHYNAWSSRGWKLGPNYVDLIMLTESYYSNSSGEVDVSVWGW